MPLLSDLLDRLPKSKENRMSANGHVLWITWQMDLDPAVTQTLQDYGGMFIISDRNQSLWFFFSTDVFLALARLSVWARFNSLPVSIEHFPAKLMLGVKREVNLAIDNILINQEILPADELDIWIHPKTHDAEFNIPGITFEKTTPKQGMANIPWTTLTADVRLPYTSTQGWYALLRPLGNPLDKTFQTNWGFMYETLEKVLQDNKFKFILHDNFVMVSVDNLRLLRIWLRDMLASFARIKIEQHDHYWPCVSVLIDRKGLNFNHDLYKKVGLQWDNLMPDFPYMSYRNAYLLGEGFAIQDIRFSDTQSSMDSWCNIALDEGGTSYKTIPLLMAGQLASGPHNGCYYCGVRTHEAVECPTMRIPISTGDVWWDLAGLSLDDINESFRHIERILTEKKLEGYDDIFAVHNNTALLMRAIFEINSAAQLRSVSRYWLSRGREFGKIQEDNAPTQRDENPAWEFLDTLCQTAPEELHHLERTLQTSIMRNPREPRLRTIQGFVGINKNDPSRARTSLKEGAALTTSPLLQAWNEYLQARLSENQGRFPEAVDQYEQIQRVLPNWKDLEYRQIVCKVKLGFAEQILGHIRKLIADDPNYFNRCLIDPELGRGQLLILTALYPLWEEAEKQAEAEKVHVQNLAEQINIWFPKDHPVRRRMHRDIQELIRLTEIKNYVAFLQVIKRRPLLEKEVNDNVQREIEELQDRFKHYLTALQIIRDEASWFPFPKVLREFSREFNECAGIINWAYASNFHDADTFQRAQSATTQLDDLLRSLRKRLKFLRVVRDATLYVLTLSRTFFWIEIVGLLLCFLGVPAIILYGDKIKLGWLRAILSTQQWEVQKILLIIVTVIALGLAALRTTIVFEKKRDKLVNEARAQREHMQQIRLERVKRQREAETEALAREKKREAERQRRLTRTPQ